MFKFSNTIHVMPKPTSLCVTDSLVWSDIDDLMVFCTATVRTHNTKPDRNIQSVNLGHAACKSCTHTFSATAVFFWGGGYPIT